MKLAIPTNIVSHAGLNYSHSVITTTFGTMRICLLQVTLTCSHATQQSNNLHKYQMHCLYDIHYLYAITVTLVVHIAYII